MHLESENFWRGEPFWCFEIFGHGV
eukprot:Gb_24178 [translate_table: standard]